MVVSPEGCHFSVTGAVIRTRRLVASLILGPPDQAALLLLKMLLDHLLLMLLLFLLLLLELFQLSRVLRVPRSLK